MTIAVGPVSPPSLREPAVAATMAVGEDEATGTAASLTEAVAL